MLTVPQSKEVYELIYPTLYAAVEFQGLKRCRTGLALLYRQPKLAHYVRKLVLRPSYRQASNQNAIDDELGLIQMMELLVPNLHLLDTFVWDGHEMPKDDIWQLLRSR